MDGQRHVRSGKYAQRTFGAVTGDDAETEASLEGSFLKHAYKGIIEEPSEVVFEEHWMSDPNRDLLITMTCVQHDRYNGSNTKTEGNTLAHLAVKFGRSYHIKVLLQTDQTYATKKNSRGWTIFDTACKRKDFDTIKVILRNVPTLQKTNYLKSGLEILCQRLAHDILQLMIVDLKLQLTEFDLNSLLLETSSSQAKIFKAIDGAEALFSLTGTSNYDSEEYAEQNRSINTAIDKYIRTLWILLFYGRVDGAVKYWLTEVFYFVRFVRKKVNYKPVQRKLESVMRLCFLFGAKVPNSVRSLSHIVTLALRQTLKTHDIRELEIDDGDCSILRDQILFRDWLNEL